MHDNKESFLVKNYRLIYFIIFVVSLLLIIISEFLFDEEGLVWYEAAFKLFAHELGFAGIVSVILVYTVETFSRERHRIAAERSLDEINHDLFRAVYKRYIPERVFEEVEKCVMLASIYRQSHEIDYTIDDFDAGDDCFKCVAQTRYKLVNQLDQATKHDVTLILERPLRTKYDKYCHVDAVQIDGKHLSATEIEAHTTITDQHVIFKYSTTVPPKGGHLSVATKSTLIKQKTDSEIWSSRLPSDGLSLTVSTPSKNVDVKASANHSEALIQKLDNPATRKWVLDYGIFPHQSIIFFWKVLDENPD